MGRAPRVAAALALGVLLAFAMGLALRLRLWSADYWLNPDEGIYHRVATAPSLDEARQTVRGNVHPPLHYWVLRALARWADDPASLRLPSLVAGLLTILACGWLGSLAGAAEGGAAGSVAGAWFGALVVALSPALALQSVTMRPYSLQALALALALAALLRYLDTGRSLWLVPFTAAFTTAALLLYSSYLVVGGVGIVLLGAFVAGRLSRRQVAELLAAALPVLAVMVWSFFVHLRPHVIGGGIHREALASWLHTQYVTGPAEGVAALRRAAGYAFSRELRPLVLVPALLAAGLALARRRGFAAFVALAVAGLAVGLSWAGLMPLGDTRHSLYLVAVEVAAGASGLAWLVKPASGPGAADTQSPRHRRARTWVSVAAAALLVGSVGWRQVRVGRASASGATDSGDEERVIRRRSVDAVLRLVRHAPVAGWLTDLQTCMLLLPLAPPGDRALRREPAFEGQRLELLGRSFAVLPTWEFPEARRESNDPVEGALSWIEGRGGLPDGRVGLVVAAWGRSAAWRLAVDLRALGQGAAVLEAAGDDKLAAVVVDMGALRAWRARLGPSRVRVPPG